MRPATPTLSTVAGASVSVAFPMKAKTSLVSYHAEPILKNSKSPLWQMNVSTLTRGAGLVGGAGASTSYTASDRAGVHRCGWVPGRDAMEEVANRVSLQPANLVGGSSRVAPREPSRDEFGEIRPFAVAHARPDGALTDGASRVAVVGVGDDAADHATKIEAMRTISRTSSALVALPREVEHDEPEVSAQERAGGGAREAEEVGGEGVERGGDRGDRERAEGIRAIARASSPCPTVVGGDPRRTRRPRRRRARGGEARARRARD